MADKKQKCLLSKIVFPAIIVVIIVAGLVFCVLYEAPNPATHADIALSEQVETPIEAEEKQHEEKDADSSMLTSVMQTKIELDDAWTQTEERIKQNGNEEDLTILENYRNEYTTLCSEAEDTSASERQATETLMELQEFMEKLKRWTEMER